jgi:hypothetical protein
MYILSTYRSKTYLPTLNPTTAPLNEALVDIVDIQPAKEKG